MTETLMWPVVCATGHRPQHLSGPQRDWARAKLRRAAEWCRDERGTKVGISGMAIGTDLWWADAVVRAGLALGAYLPCPQQPHPRWPAEDHAEWQRLLALADPDHSRTIAPEYHVRVLHKRNREMLAVSHAVVAVWLPEHRHGGTWRALCAANTMGKPGVFLDPSRELVRLGLPDTSNGERP